MDIAIIGAKRTPIGGFQGELSALSAPNLGSVAIGAALADAKLGSEEIAATLMGIVLPAGVGQAPARQASLKAGLSLNTPCVAISKVCGSGMQAVIQACQMLKVGDGDAVVAGGMESMSNAPYLSPKTRSGARLGHSTLIDHMFFDGLEDACDQGRLMGSFAEDCARRYNFTREAQDDFAIASLNRARDAQKNGLFEAEIAPVTVASKRTETEVSTDESPVKARIDKIPTLRPAFDRNGTVTAANSSSISDGAAALVLMDGRAAEARSIPVRARIKGYSGYADETGLFTTAPIAATAKLLDKLGWTVDDVDLWEVNEAFAVVAMVFMQELGIPHAKLNVNGGACALGHPIGASGARILVTLLHALEQRDLKRGVAAICIGGGEALAVAIERS